jgi:hypothetical protein
MTHTGSFDITTPSEFLEKMILPQYQEFLDNTASSRAALLCVIVAYHMYEWVNGPNRFIEREFMARYPTKASVWEFFDLANRLANSTKHFKNRIATRAQSGFSPAFSDDFVRPLCIIRDDGSEISADILIGTLVEFWRGAQAGGLF